MSMFKRSSLIPLAALLATTPVMAQNAPVNTQAQTVTQSEGYRPVTLATWGRLSQRERQIAIIAAIEGLLLAAATPNNPPQFGAQCLLRDTPEVLEKKMREVIPQFGNEAFVDVFLALTGCLDNTAPRP